MSAGSRKKDTLNDKNTAKIAKIVYFDEGSAIDYLQLRIGGSFVTEIKTTKDNSASGEAEAGGEVGLRTWFAGLWKSSISAGASLNASFQNDTVTQSVLTNTALSDFLKAVEEDEQRSKSCMIARFDGFKIREVPGSISSMSLLTPYLAMLQSGQRIEAGGFSISPEKLDSTFSSAKGYFEFLGTGKLGDQDQKKELVFRFNGLGFKNNYKQSNLLNMDLRFYAVRVGSTRLSDLVAENELSMPGLPSVRNPDYPNRDADPATAQPSSEELDMYDVILAGVMGRAA